MPSRWGRRVMSYSESALSTHGCVYTFNFLYAVTNIVVFLKGAYVEANTHDDFQRYVTAMARGAGGLINLNSAVVLLLASRSLLGLLRETPLNLVLPIDKAMPDLHRAVGSIIFLSSVVHVCSHIPVYAIKNVWSSGLTGYTSLFITGLMLVGTFLIIYSVARPTVLHESYELFYRTHVGGAIVYYALLLIHGTHKHTPNSWKFVIGPIIIYVCDVMFRSLREKKSYLLLLKHSAACQGQNIVKIRLPRVFHYQAGQYAEIKVPLLSRFQWHPFTISSAPHESEIVFYIKAVGDWTQSLYTLFENRTVLNSDLRDDVEIHIRGPYGAPAQHVGQFDRVVLIGGGVGATPFCSVVKDAYHWIKNWTPRQHQRPTDRNSDNGGPTEPNGANQEGLGQQPGDDGPRQESQRQHAVSMSASGPAALVVTEQESQQAPSSPGNSSQGNRTWGLLATNVISEAITSEHSLPVENVDQTSAVYLPEPRQREIQSQHGQSHRMRRERERGSLSSSNNTDGMDHTSMYTARDTMDIYSSAPGTRLQRASWVADGSVGNGQIIQTRGGNERQVVDIEAGDAVDAITAIETEGSNQNVSTEVHRDRMRRHHGRRRRGIRRSSFDEDGITAIDGNWMGSYYGNSSSSHRHSMDYVTALQTVAFSEESEGVFQKSLDMMIGMSFGSTSLMRTMQYKRMQQSVGEGRQSTAQVGLEMFRSRRVMFLLYMRSVTINMLILWLLILRFTIAGVAYAFNELKLFEDGVQLYEIEALNVIDLVISLILVFLFSLPTLIELMEIGAALLHGLELFVLTPIAVFGVVIDVFALRGYYRDVDKVFNLFHVFVIWPILTILVMIRLLRVIGERITQVQTVHSSHSTTRAVDFFWTAPTSDDDLWLVGELAKYSDMKELRLHRYLTREQAPPPSPQLQPQQPQEQLDLERGQENRHNSQQQRNVVSLRSMETNHGRPNWTEIFNTVAERSRNNSTIGVFFCGPMSMSRDIQEASMEAMRNSIVRGLQSGVQAMRGLEEIFGEAISANEYTGDVNQTMKDGEGTNRGCNITIVFKQESFS